MQTVQAILGFVAGEPQLTVRTDGTSRLYIRVGINHWQSRNDGTFTQLPSTFHDLVQYGRGAELSYQRLRKGDNIIAQGRVREYTRTVDGAERPDEVFIAKRVAHDPNTTTYEVHRKRSAPDRNPPEQSPQTHPPAQATDRELGAEGNLTADPVSRQPPPPADPPNPAR